ncbi:MAG: nitroreductase [Alphaproteobacteria bacterium]|nr:nitroreductase [Alphaproteobacteria bacterium]
MQKNLEAWDVSETDFPRTGTLADKLEFCLRYAVLAPSAYNSQPWYFTIDGDTLSLYADRRFALPVVDPDDRQLIMSCGAALYALRLAIRYFGYQEYTQLVPNPADENLIARVQMGDVASIPSEEEQALFYAITHRYMNRSAFKNMDVPKEILQTLEEAATKEGAWLHVCKDDERDVVAHFIAEGDQIQMASKNFRRELASWINERRYVSGDGYPDYARSFKEMMSSSKPRILRRFETQPGQVVKDDEIAAGCPVLAIIGSEKGGTADRIYAGQAFMRVLLQAQASGLAVSTLNQPCEVPDLRLRLHDEIDHSSARPHYILRIGYADPVINHTPRRPLESFIERSDMTAQYAAPANDQAKTGQKTSVWAKFQQLFLAK